MNSSVRAAASLVGVAVCLCVFVPPVVADDFGCAGQMNVLDYPTEGPSLSGVVAAADGYAYVAACYEPSDDPSTGEFRVFDVREPSHPVETGSLDIKCATKLVLSGRYAYVGQYASPGHVSENLVIDISDPYHPVQVGSISGVGSIRAVSNGYAYSVDRTTMWVLDLTDPTSPRRVGFLAYDFEYFFTDVAVSGTHAYLTSERDGFGWGYLQVVDLTDPETPDQLSRVKVSDWWPRGVAVSGDHAYVVSGTVRGTTVHGDLTVVDVSDPEVPVVGTSFNVGNAGRPVVSGHFLYFISTNIYSEGYLHVFNVSEPSQPRWVHWRDAIWVNYGEEREIRSFYADAVCVCGRYVYTVSYLGLQAFDNRGCLYQEMHQEMPLAVE
jgi:hypothetical protein